MRITSDYIRKRIEDILAIKELNWFPYNIRCELKNLKKIAIADNYCGADAVKYIILVDFLNNLLLYALGNISDKDMMTEWRKYLNVEAKYFRSGIYSPIARILVNSTQNHPAIRYSRLLPVK